MMNIAQLDTTVRRLEQGLVDRKEQGRREMVEPFHAWRRYVAGEAKSTSAASAPAFTTDRQRAAFNLAINMARSASMDVRKQADLQRSDQEYINRHLIEWQRKYTLSVACLLLFLIGAPFGSIVRKGGLGLPLVASVIFFVLYYVVGMIAEKAVRESAMGPIGMWVSTFALLPIGLVLTAQATTDSALFDGASWRRFFSRLLHPRRRKPTDDN